MERFRIEAQSQLSLDLFASPVEAGFPSPAEDYIEQSLDFNEYLVEHPAASFCVRANGDSMIEAGIHLGDILVVDRSLTAKNGSIIIAALDGEFTVKYFYKKENQVTLKAANPQYKDIEVEANLFFEVWGVVTYVIHCVK